MDALFYKDTMYGGGGAMRGNYFNPIIYSTEERVVGVGENNKPLYQKTVVSSTLTAETGETVLTGIDSLKVISLRTNRTYPFYISTYNISGSGTEYGIVNHTSNGDVELYNAGRSASVVIEAVLQYTKTSDVAGSGSYNTLGVPNVHYTTDEQVIGTWMGETLYRRVYDFSNNPINVPAGSWLKVANEWQIMPIRGTVIIPSSRASFEVAVDCDDNDGLYIQSWLAYSNVKYLIVEYTKTS